MKKNRPQRRRIFGILPPPLQQVDRTYVILGKRRLSYFGGCDYFRLASHPKVLEALKNGLEKYGLNVAASRSTTGNHRLYGLLEARLEEFFDAECAVLLSNGYATNLAVAQALARNFSHALIDERAHASLVDAAAFLDCPVIRFSHCAADDVARAVRRIGPAAKPILLTDGMFSHDGGVAPLQAYLNILPSDAIILVDDAHGAGVLGKTGKGSLEREQVARRRIIQTIALSKAFGVYGGAVLTTRKLGQLVQGGSRLFNGNTPLPLPLASAALQAIQILQSDASLRQRLLENSNYVKRRLREAGFALAEKPGPIIPVVPRDDRTAMTLKRKLIAARIHPPFIKYPGGPERGYFRFVLSSEHTRAQLDNLLKILIAQTSG